MKNSPYFKIIIFAILSFILGFLIPNTPYFKNKTIKDLEKENEKLQTEISINNKKIDILNSELNNLKSNKILLEKKIVNTKTNIIILQNKIDSISNLVSYSDANLTKIKKTGYEEINNVSNWNSNQRINFFTEYFKNYNK